MFKKLVLVATLFVPFISYSQDELPPTGAQTQVPPSPVVQQPAGPAATPTASASENWDKFKQERQAKKQREIENKMKQEEMRLQHQMQMDAMKQEHKKNADENYQREKEEFLKRFRKAPTDQATPNVETTPNAKQMNPAAVAPVQQNPVTVDEVQDFED
jgi:hypothetical protein